jgi:pimeloyl-ACP methyl ester carboxylesterase
LHAWRRVGRFDDRQQDIYLSRLRSRAARDATVRYFRNVLLHELPYFMRHSTSVRLATPTLHLNGECDPLSIGVPQNHRPYSDDMRLELIPSCGHFIAEECPAELLERTHRFLA